MIQSCASNTISQFSNYDIINTDSFLSSNFQNSCFDETKAQIKRFSNELSNSVNSSQRSALWLKLGNCHFINKEFEVGKYFYDLFLTSPEGTPKQNSQVYTKFGALMESKDLIFMALEYYQKALELDTSNHAAQYLYGLLLLKTSEYEKGLSFLSKLNTIYPNSRILKSAQGIAFYMSGKKQFMTTDFLSGLDSQSKLIFELVLSLGKGDTANDSLKKLSQIESDIDFMNSFIRSVVSQWENNEISKN